MSGEFGDGDDGVFFHAHIERAAGACESGKADITRLWGDVLEAMLPIARAISWLEAADSTLECTLSSIRLDLPDVKKAIDAAEKYLQRGDALNAAISAVRKCEHTNLIYRPNEREWYCLDCGMILTDSIVWDKEVRGEHS